MCPYCPQMFINRSKHWCISCPTMVYEKKCMLDYVTDEHSIVQDVELMVAIIYSQDNRRYKGLLQLLKKIFFVWTVNTRIADVERLFMLRYQHCK